MYFFAFFKPHQNHLKYSLIHDPGLNVEDPPNNLSTDFKGNSDNLYPCVYDLIDSSNAKAQPIGLDSSSIDFQTFFF